MYQEVDPYSRVWWDSTVGLEKKKPKYLAYMYDFFKYLRVYWLAGWGLKGRGLPLEAWILHQDYLTVDYTAPSQVMTRFSDYYKIQKGDLIMDPWHKKSAKSQKFLVLRREREGLRWDEYPRFSLDVQGVRNDFHHFFFPTTLKIALDEAIFQGDDFAESEEVAVRSHVMYLSLREFFRGSENEEVFTRKIANILGDFRRRTLGKFDSHSVLLDLRNSSPVFSLKKQLLILGSFLPHRPVVQVQSREGVRVYGNRSQEGGHPHHGFYKRAFGGFGGPRHRRVW